jgi:hypothetical protein
LSDNVAFQSATLATPAAATSVAADELTYSGDTAKVQVLRLVHVSGAEGAKTLHEIADATNGLDVDVTRVPAPLSTAGGGTEATALRVTVASDSTGVLSVDDNGGSLTIDASSLPLPTGASTAANQATIIGHLDGVEGALATVAQESGGNLAAAAASLAILDNIVAGNEAQVDIVSSALPTGAATLAEQQTQTTALQLLDNIVETNRAAVNPISGQAGVAAGEGASGATVQRVVQATRALTAAGPGTFTATTSDQEALAAAGTRKRLVLTNTGDNPIFLGLGATAVAGSGIYLGPGGGSVTLDEKAEGTTVLQGAIRSITTGGDSNLAIQSYS